MNQGETVLDKSPLLALGRSHGAFFLELDALSNVARGWNFKQVN